jgi:hypothetical protein
MPIGIDERFLRATLGIKPTVKSVAPTFSPVVKTTAAGASGGIGTGGTTLTGLIDLGLYLDGSGATDNFSAWFDLEDIVGPVGGLNGVITIEHGSGWAEGSHVVTVTGGGTGVTAATAVAVAGHNGRVAFITVTSPGSGYRIVSRQIGGTGIVSGSPTITINGGYTTPTNNITVGMSITHPLFPAGTTVLSVTSTTVTASANATQDSATYLSGRYNYSWIYFGVPLFSLAGAGSGWVGRAVVGEGRVLRLPPGRYVSSGSQFMCLHNTTIEAEGAILMPPLKSNNGLGIGPQCINVKIVGLQVQNLDTDVITPPASRGVGFGFGLKGYNITLENTKTRNIPNFSVTLGADTDTEDYFQGFNIIGHTCQGCSGDGIHIGAGIRFVQVTNAIFLTHGDDALAVYPDVGGYGAVNKPYGISVTGLTINDNAWRGIFLGGCKQVAISGVMINGCGGYGIEINQCQDVAITGATLYDIGNYDVGYRDWSSIATSVAATALVAGTEYVIITLGSTNFTLVGASATPTVGEQFTATGAGTGTGVAETSSRNAIYINDVDRVSVSGVTFGAIMHTTLINVTNSTDVLIKAQTIQGKTLANTSGNTNVTVSA